MRKWLMLIVAPVFLLSACSQRHVTTTASGKTVYGEKAEVIQRLQEASTDLEELMNAPDNAIPQEVLDGAKCVAVVPTLVKGGFVVGGQHGRGVATCRTARGGWSDPAFFAITGGSWGAQIGLESVDLVMVSLDDKGMLDLLNSQVKLGAEAGAAAGPLGREAQASTDWKMNTKILMYSRAKGLFAGADVSGAAVKPDLDSTVAFYGKPMDTAVLLSGKAPNLPDAQPFLQAVAKAVRQAKTATGDTK
jgi:SH3 domain-containing YSC84-like protein 1